MKSTYFYINFLILFFFFYTIQAQTFRVSVEPKGTKKCGYVNLKGDFIWEPKYNFCLDYSEQGTAVTFSMATNCFLIDSIGNKIIPETKLKLYNNNPSAFAKSPQWNTKSPYKGGIFLLKKGGKLGGVNTKGKISVPLIYDELTEFNEGYALGERDKIFYVVDINGKETPIEVNDYRIIYIKHFSAGLAPIEVKGQKWGFIDTLGKIVIAPQFKTVGYFNGNHAWARIKNSTIGFINKKGEWVIEPQFSTVYNFDKESGIALVEDVNDSSLIYIDTTGNIQDYNLKGKLYDFSNGLAVAKLNKKVGYINNRGEWVIEPIYSAGHDFYNGYAAVKIDKSWGLIDKKGEWILQPKYGSVGRVINIE